MCGKALNCAEHSCKLPCHAGACPPCNKKSLRRCRCGGEEALRPCSDPPFDCGNVCGKAFACGSHVCERVCHDGDDCGPCPLTNRRSCPCGKKQVSNVSCTADIPGESRLVFFDRTSSVPEQLSYLPTRTTSAISTMALYSTLSSPFSSFFRFPLPSSLFSPFPPFFFPPPLPVPFLSTITFKGCGDTCEKLLKCRKHHCNERCHAGACPTCRETAERKCRCAHVRARLFLLSVCPSVHLCLSVRLSVM